MPRLWTRWRRDRRGGVAILAAFSAGILMSVSALAVDLGSIFLQSRQLQGVADLAALQAANNLTNAQAAAQATVQANAWTGGIQTTVVTGAYSANAAIPASQRFTAGGAAPNAAQVTLSAPAQLYFGGALLGRQTVTLTRTATAATAQVASFSIGSTLAGLQGGVANALLSGLTGSQVQLSVMSYQALAGANVDLLQYSQALQTSLNLQGASFNQVLAGQLTTGTALNQLAVTLNSEGQTQAAQAVQQIAVATNAGTLGTASLPLSQLINLGPYGQQDHADPATGASISVNALQLTNAMLELADGGHQVQLQLSSAVPGLAGINAWLAIGQRPSNSAWLAVDDDGQTVISTAQARLYIQAQLAPGSSVLSAAGVSLLNVPIYVQLASAQAKLSAIACPTASTPEQVTLTAAPSLGELALGQVDTTQLSNFTTPLTVSPANLVSLPLISVTGQAQVNIGGGDWQSVTFNQSQIQNLTMQTVSTTNITQATLTSLLANTNVSVSLAGLNLGLSGGAIPSAVQSSLSSAGGSLDSVLNALTSLLGVQLGEANLWVNGVRCNDAALVA